MPGAFSPISLRNWTGHCHYVQPPELVEALREHSDVSRRRRRDAEQVATYLDKKRAYIHLVDGGVADNLGLRGPLETITLAGGIRARFRQLAVERPSHIAVIVVNAEVHPDPPYSVTAAGPGLAAMLSAVSGVQIYSYNFETLELVNENLREWRAELSRDDPARPIDTYISEIAFAGVADDQERHYLNELPTSFSLSDEQIDRLIAVGRRELRRSPEFQRLLQQLTAP